MYIHIRKQNDLTKESIFGPTAGNSAASPNLLSPVPEMWFSAQLFRFQHTLQGPNYDLYAAKIASGMKFQVPHI